MLPRVVIALFFVSLLVPTVARAQASTAGVPKGAEAATISRHVDGDKVKVEINGEEEEVLLAGIDAPEKGECFAKESGVYLKKLTPTHATVYLERSGDDRDGKGHLIRYVWIPGKEGKKATLLNTKLLREGYAGFDESKDTPK
jgi:endonuclease YncB( thermonuclease family)